ncbi:HD-GYP domain-containing protein [Sporomusa aerivorans]|uniref:HD-GYP domain-containing protein n=1 Tax=Sporomusa aerivorans TaxID=204936 RepID=UPI00352A2AEE
MIKTSTDFSLIESKMKFLFDGLHLDSFQTAKHCCGVNRLVLLLADKLDYLQPAEVLFLHWGSLLHDIGKAEIQATVLNKKASLTSEEYAQIKYHPLFGYTLAQSMDLPEQVCEIILCHHERYDGTGYPCHLKGKEIPLLARICSVVDAFEAMVAKRSYRTPLSCEAAFRELVSNKGTQFDPDLVNRFMDLKEVILENQGYLVGTCSTCEIE